MSWRWWISGGAVKQSVSAVFSQVNGRKTKLHAHHILGLRAIIPASSSLVWLRDLSSSSSSCADSNSGSGNSISFAEAKRLMRLVNVEALKTKLGMEGKDVIGYSELLEACESMGVARSHEEAAAFARVLDEAGVVLLFRDKVYLHPDKMKRKDVSINKVYDARALRVVVGDKNGTLHGPAVQCCYSLLNIVHKLWTPIDGEFDDYIVNPKPSGYQSLHTAVQGPDSSPLEVQIRTLRMHEYAEHGLAAHWLYKETGNKLSAISSMDDSEIEASAYFSEDMDDQSPNVDGLFQKYSSLKVGHPVLRVEGSHLLAAVIIRVDNGGRELLVAVSFGLAASEAVADRRSSFQIKRWEAYARLYKQVSDEWWCEPGHGDWCTCLEKYTLCRDGMYHKQDQFERLLPTFIQVINLTEQEETEYWAVVSAVFDGRQVDSVKSRPSFVSINSTSLETSINNKVRLLRTMLQWEEQLRSEASLGQPKHSGNFHVSPGSVVHGEVVIVCWPHGEIMRLNTGSTAADAARKVGLEGKLVLVNGHLVLPCTELKDGDVVEVRI